MKCWAIDKPGGIADLTCKSVEFPRVAAGQAALRVLSCGLNFADLLLMKGTYQSRPGWPLVPGVEVCGIIESVGCESDSGRIGQKVVAYCGHGGLSERVVVPLDVCAVVPDGLDDISAAAIPVAYGSSELALARRARLQAGEWLVVSGAGGGVGLTAVELGKVMGARVIALARGAAKLDAAKAMGADITLDTESVAPGKYALRDAIFEATGGQGINVIYDPVGGTLMEAMMRATAFEARVMPIGFASGDVPEIKANHLLVKNIDVIGFWWGDYFLKAPLAVRESLERLLHWAAIGRIKPHVSTIANFADVPEALTLIKERKATGKVVVKVA